MFVGIGATGQIVGGTLTGKGLVTEAFEVGTSFRGRSGVNLAALVDDDDLVEEVVDTLTALVEGDESRLAESAGHDPQGLDQIQRVRLRGIPSRPGVGVEGPGR